jgi:hypothetical protein
LSLDLFYIGKPIPDISPELEEGQKPRLLPSFERFLRYRPARGKVPPREHLCCILYLHVYVPRFFSEHGKKTHK